MDQTAAVQDLQFMLKQLARRNQALPVLAVTGIFDELTLEAVMVFQRDYPLPVTGIVDAATWEAIVDAYREDQLRFGAPIDLRVLPNGEYSSPHGSSDHPRSIAETIFASLPTTISNFSQDSLSGNLFILQRLAGIPDNGHLDRLTWDFLARLHHAVTLRRALEHSHL